MAYGICNLSMAPLRAIANDTSEMMSQVLFGETFEILETEKEWSKIRLSYDNSEGYIDNKQYLIITAASFLKLTSEKKYISGEMIDFITNKNNELTTIPLGADLPFYKNNRLEINAESYVYEGTVLSDKKAKSEIPQTAFTYLNTPFLWGGKTPFGMDASGFVQMVYKLCGYALFREVKAQAIHGKVLSFIEESAPGDLAFFDNEEGEIIHVGIILKDYNIIHCHGKVRIDTLDHSGIYNVDTQKHTHKLRIIKKMI